MDHPVVPARGPVNGTFAVPASKSLLQRVLALAALADGPCEPQTPGAQPPGEDVARLEAALGLLGRWTDGALGASCASLALDLGFGATGLRLATALATVRPAGARTLVRGRPALLSRPHRDLRLALERLGGHVRRRHSGALRVIAGGMRGGRLAVGCRRSSQHITALMLLAPRLGGLKLELVDQPVSRPYIELTRSVLAGFGIPATVEGLDAPGGLVRVPEGAPRAARYAVEPDASAAAAWWAAAALTGGRVEVAGIGPDCRQADMALLRLLPSMGAQVGPGESGMRVVGPREGLEAAGTLDLADAPDLVPLVAVLAARARGVTRLTGVAHVRGKESDRLQTTAAGLRALGARVEVLDDGLAVHGGPLTGARVAVAGDHRLAFAFGVLGLTLPGVVLAGAQAASKSHPRFLDDLARAARS